MLAHAPKRLPAYFYRTAGGREPVRGWLRSLEIEDRKIVGEDIKDVEFSWPAGMPLVRPLGRELWEVRSNLTGGKIGRVIFCVHEGRMVRGGDSYLVLVEAARAGPKRSVQNQVAVPVGPEDAAERH